MTLVRQNMLVIATAGLLGGLAIATVTPYQSASAYSGQSLVFAEQACLDYGVTPHTAAFESCVSRAASAFDRGQPDVAYMQARSTRDARDACQVLRFHTRLLLRSRTRLLLRSHPRTRCRAGAPSRSAAGSGPRVS